MNEHNPTIWDFNRILTRRLFRWNLINILSGLWLAQRGGFWRGFGSQSIGWGLINIAIAIIGGQATERRRKALDNPAKTTTLAKESRNLRRLLWINTGLDILYILGGWRFAKSRSYHEIQGQGIGSGIMLQGLLLFIFDLTQAQQVPAAPKTIKTEEI